MAEFSNLTDRDLVERVATLVAGERAATAALVGALGELDARRLYLAAGCSSLFTYCTQVLHLSESAAYVRIEAARIARRYPEVLERLLDGRLSLSTARMLGPVLAPGNEHRLLDAAAFKSKREVDELVAAERPRPPVATIVRKLPVRRAQPHPEATPSATIQPAADTLLTPDELPTDGQQTGFVARPTAPPPIARPLAPALYKIQFTLSRDGHDRLRRAQDLLRHVHANGDIAAVFERALVVLVGELEKRTFAATARPRGDTAAGARGRHVPAAVKRRVWARDGGRCAFVGSLGRCRETGFLEYHHVIPFADGGKTTVENLQLRCAAHNAYEADLWSGANVVRERPAGAAVM